MEETNSKIVDPKTAIGRLASGNRIMVGGFGNSGVPDTLIDALAESNLNDLTVISNDLGSPGVGLGKLLTHGQISNLIGNYYNWNPEVAEANNAGTIKATLIPQGSFAEAIRAAGVGIPAFYTPTSAGTDLSEGKETKEFNGRPHVLEHAIQADVALVRAHKADTLGNLTYFKTSRNFNPLMAMAAKLTIVEVDEIVPAGDLDPECVVTPHLFVNMIVEKRV